MLEHDFLNAIIDDGIAEVEAEYLRPDQSEKRRGAIDGFSACRDRSMEEIASLSLAAKANAERLRRDNIQTNFWYWRYYDLQTEWVLNVLNARLRLLGHPHGETSARGMMKAGNILDISIPK